MLRQKKKINQMFSLHTLKVSGEVQRSAPSEIKMSYMWHTGILDSHDVNFQLSIEIMGSQG